MFTNNKSAGFLYEKRNIDFEKKICPYPLKIIVLASFPRIPCEDTNTDL